jgi:hypothetical protein
MQVQINSMRAISGIIHHAVAVIGRESRVGGTKRFFPSGRGGGLPIL